MQAWVVWLIVAAVLGIAELLTLTLDLALIAVAALAAAGVAATGLGPGFQLAAFALAAVMTLGVVRPVARRHMRGPPRMRFGVDALIGREAVVTSEITKETGLVRIGGEEWTARPFDGSLTIPAGATVDVLAIEGATALVYPREEPWPNSLPESS